MAERRFGPQPSDPSAEVLDSVLVRGQGLGVLPAPKRHSCEFRFVRLIFRVTATTKHSSRRLLPAAGGVGGRTGLSDSFVHSFIKYILGALARASVPGPGDQWGTLRPWLGAPSEPERAGLCARAHLLLASVLCDLWGVGLQFVNGGVESAFSSEDHTCVLVLRHIFTLA